MSAGSASGESGINTSNSVSSVFAKLLLAVTALTLLLSLKPVETLHAQQIGTRWEQPVVLFDAGEAAQLFTPFVFEDTDGGVKVLWEVFASDAADPGELVNAIYCISSNGADWSAPVDVIAPVDGSRAFWPRHALDRYGRVHVVWVGSSGKFFYSRAPSALACDARNWETQELPVADQVLYGDIEIDDKGIIHVAYAARAKDVFYVRSGDDGLSWSQPIAVSRVSPTTATAAPSIAVSENGSVHIAWEEDQLPNGVPSLGLYYARSDDAGQSWTAPIRFSQSEGEYTEPAITTLADGSVHLLWNGRASTRGRYHQQSTDGGDTWSASYEFIPKNLGGGQTGAPGFVIDSAGRLHVVAGTDDTTYMALTGQGWLPPQDIAAFSTFGGMEDQSIGLVGGNQLYVIADAGFRQILLIRGMTDAPGVLPNYTPLPAAPSTPQAATATPDIRPIQAPSTTAAVAVPSVSSIQRSQRSLSPLVISVGLASLFVAVVVGLNVRRRS
jgi:hypothetical protein